MARLKLWTQSKRHLDLALLAENCVDVVDDQQSAQAVVAFNHIIERSLRAVLVYMEPALGPGYLDAYVRPGDFHTVFMFGQPVAANQFEITTDPIVFPYPPETIYDEDIGPLALGDRKVYYAGTRSGFLDAADVCGRIGLYHVRNQVALGVRAAGFPTLFEGVGWERASRLDPNWDVLKRESMRYSHAAFVLCLENSQMRNYVSEKIHHGFQSGRVVCYLGNPQIHEWVPEEAFINLNRWFNPVTKVFDHEAFAERLRTITQEEYDAIRQAAKRWRQSAELEARWDAQRRRLTNMIIERIV